MRVKALGMAQLVVNVDDEAPAVAARTRFHHKIEGEFSSELDETVVAGFCDDKDVLDGGFDFCTTKLLAHFRQTFLVIKIITNRCNNLLWTH